MGEFFSDLFHNGLWSWESDGIIVLPSQEDLAPYGEESFFSRVGSTIGETADDLTTGIFKNGWLTIVVIVVVVMYVFRPRSAAFRKGS